MTSMEFLQAVRRISVSIGSGFLSMEKFFVAHMSYHPCVLAAYSATTSSSDH